MTYPDASRKAEQSTEENQWVARGQVMTPERAAYEKREAEIKGEFEAELADEYLSGYPKNVADAVFNRAWANGHASGYQDVEGHYMELAELVEIVAPR